jgi:hypothetical protein
MRFQKPEPGCVISYSYLWRYEHHAGHEEGKKNRPCVIILATEMQDNNIIVTVAPITHKCPGEVASYIEIPPKVKSHLHLDDECSFIIINEVNQFTWPGYDLRPIPGNKDRYDFGFIPPRLFEQIKTRIVENYSVQDNF